MDKCLLFGLDNSNHHFDSKHKDDFGKNIFTNAFPISLACYLDQKGLGPICIEAYVQNGNLTTRQVERPLKDLINCDPAKAIWLFEESFDEYDSYATGTPNRSDIVVKDLGANKHASAFEVKLITVPNSATAKRSRDEQSCELVTRPPSIEQLCFSIAKSFGPNRRHEINDIIAECCVNPMDYDWTSESFMLDHLDKVVLAAETIAKEGVANQNPFALSAIWRTDGQNPVLDKECFDVFVWTDMAFLQLFTDSAKDGGTSISRPSRSVIWLVKSLLDYAVQGKVTFGKTHAAVTFGAQTDKAASFAGPKMLKFIGGNAFLHPRISSSEYKEIIAPEAFEFLKPERRLDAVLAITEIVDKYRD